MSTRANVVLREHYSVYKEEKNAPKVRTEELWFYRHSDGYPEGMLPLLNVFMDWLWRGKIINNLSQSAGWLIILGAIEYGTIPQYEKEKSDYEFARNYGDLDTVKEPGDWKCGSIEPTTGQHGDIEYLYEIDLTNKELKYSEV